MLKFLGDILGAAFSPVRYLWPWLVAEIVFYGFLLSPQGRSLADTPPPGGDQWTLIGLLVFLIYMVGASWFASVTSRAFERSPKSYASWVVSREGWASISAAVWIVTLLSGPVWAFGYFAKSQMALSVAAISTMATIGMIFLATRLRFRTVNWITRSVAFSKRHRFVLAFFVAVLAVLPLYLGAKFVSGTPTILAQIGPLLVALVGITAFATLIAVSLVVIPICLGHAWLGWIFAASWAVYAFASPLTLDQDNPLLRKQREAATVQKKVWMEECADQAPDIEEEVRRRYVVDKVGRDDKNKLYFISAEGGGIRAAYWTAMGLANLNLDSQGKFAENVTVLSGVSGGSLGIATWVGAQELTDKSLTERATIISQFLSSDFLSPLIGGLLFLDAPRSIFGSAWPSERRDHVFERALFDRWLQLTGSDFFARPMRRLCLKGFKRAPQIVFNSTDASTGSPVPLSNSNFHKERPFDGMYGNSLDQTSLRWATVAQAVSISARFPILSPAAEVGIAAEQVRLPQLEFAFEDFASQHRIEPQRPTQFLPESSYSNPQDELDRFLISVERPLEKNREEMRAKEAELDAMAEWPTNSKEQARIGVLVDGGYYDNSGTDAVKKAIKKALTFGESGKYKTYHFSNDPADTCAPLPKDWEKRPAARFLRDSQSFVKCDFELAAVEEALAPRPFQFFTTPLEALAAVRGTHANDAAKPLEVPLGAGVAGSNKISAAVEMNSYRYAEVLKMKTMHEIPGWELTKEDIDKRSAEHRALIEQLARKKKRLSKEDELAEIKTWKERAIFFLTRWNCEVQSVDQRPPLGWMLNKADVISLSCLSARAAVRQNLEDLRSPWDNDEFSPYFPKPNSLFP